MTRKHGKKGSVGTFREELEDVMLSLKRKSRKQFKKENIERIAMTKQWAKRYSAHKPKWTPVFYSYYQRPIKLLKGYYSTAPQYYATRIRKIKRKKGTCYYLDLYNTLARKLR